MCAHHYELKNKKKAEELERENTHQSWNQQTPICYVQQQPMQQYEDDIRMNIQHSHYQPQDIGAERLNSVGVDDFCELESNFFRKMKYGNSKAFFGSSKMKISALVLRARSFFILICVFLITLP